MLDRALVSKPFLMTMWASKAWRSRESFCSMTILTSAQTESWALAERPHAPHNAVKTKTVIHSQFRHARADTPSWLSPTRTPPKRICALPDV